jgi:nitrate reductase gamma subunit
LKHALKKARNGFSADSQQIIQELNGEEDMQESALLHFASHRLQEVSLAFMAIVYSIRLYWLFRFKAGRDRQPRTGRLSTDPLKGAAYSLANIVMPWAMESTRTNIFFWVQFVLFHLGVTAAITLSFIIPYAPSWLESKVVVWLFQIFIGSAFLVGCYRMVRRVANPVMRAISTPDDYFCLALLTVWFFFSGLSAPNDVSGGEGHLVTFFFLTAFFLVYVPFSKISHYLYYPFMRFYLGRSLGHRGVYPIRRSAMPGKG